MPNIEIYKFQMRIHCNYPSKGDIIWNLEYFDYVSKKLRILSLMMRMTQLWRLSCLTIMKTKFIWSAEKLTIYHYFCLSVCLPCFWGLVETKSLLEKKLK